MFPKTYYIVGSSIHVVYDVVGADRIRCRKSELSYDVVCGVRYRIFIAFVIKPTI